MSDYKGYVVISNCCKCEVATYEVDMSKDIRSELTRVLTQNKTILEEGDVITFESR